MKMKGPDGKTKAKIPRPSASVAIGYGFALFLFKRRWTNSSIGDIIPESVTEVSGLNPATISSLTESIAVKTKLPFGFNSTVASDDAESAF